MKKFFDDTMWKFIIVGIANTVVGAGTMFLLYNVVHCGYVFSTAANYIVGGVLSFFLNKYFTFNSKAWSWSQVWRFALNVLLCWILAYGVAKPIALRLLEGHSLNVQENVAMLVGMVLYTGLNYLGQRFFAFKREEGKQ